MTTHRMALSQPMVLAMLRNAKTCTRRLVSRTNSRRADGSLWSTGEWALLDWSYAHPLTDGAWNTLRRGDRGLVSDAWVSVYPIMAAGHTLYFCEATRDGSGLAKYEADRENISLRGGLAVWIKANGEKYKVNRLSARYMPHAWSRLSARIVSVTPSTPADVNDADEARAEGLCTVETQFGLAWGWRGDGRVELPALTWTPQQAYDALLTELHGSRLAPSTPMWRFQFQPEVTR